MSERADMDSHDYGHDSSAFDCLSCIDQGDVWCEEDPSLLRGSVCIKPDDSDCERYSLESDPRYTEWDCKLNVEGGEFLLAFLIILPIGLFCCCVFCWKYGSCKNSSVAHAGQNQQIKLRGTNRAAAAHLNMIRRQATNDDVDPFVQRVTAAHLNMMRAQATNNDVELGNPQRHIQSLLAALGANTNTTTAITTKSPSADILVATPVQETPMEAIPLGSEGDDSATKLQKLAEMYADGSLTYEEWDQAKKDVINGL